MHMTRRRLTLMIGAAAVAAGLALPSAAHADPAAPATPMRTVQVNAPYEDFTRPTIDGARCFGFAANQADCRMVTFGSARWTGTLRGEATYTLDTWFDLDHPGRLLYEGFGTQGNHFVDVYIEGCGRGGFQMEEWDGFVDYAPPADYDPVTDSGPGFNRWRVQPGSGTGELGGLRGEGVNNWSVHQGPGYPLGGQTTYGNGVFTGTFTCRAKPEGARAAAVAAAASSPAGASSAAKGSAPSARRAAASAPGDVPHVQRFALVRTGSDVNVALAVAALVGLAGVALVAVTDR